MSAPTPGIGILKNTRARPEACKLGEGQEEVICSQVQDECNSSHNSSRREVAGGKSEGAGASPQETRPGFVEMERTGWPLEDTRE